MHGRVWVSHTAAKLPASYFVRRRRLVGSSSPGCSRAQSATSATHCSGGAAQARIHRNSGGQLYVHEWDELKADKSAPGKWTVFAHFAEVALPIRQDDGGHEVLLFDDARGLYLKIGRKALMFSKDKKRAKKWARLVSGEFLVNNIEARPASRQRAQQQ